MLPKLTFVIGGAASGKSAWSEKYLLRSQLAPVYLATARILDGETKKKVNAHKSRRSDRWRIIEADLDLSGPLARLSETQAVLIDCATMWLTNHMLDNSDLFRAEDALLTAIHGCKAPVIVVSNEVGQGIVPDNALARQFREAQGRLNVRLAEKADLAVLVTAGLPQALKGKLP